MYVPWQYGSLPVTVRLPINGCARVRQCTAAGGSCQSWSVNHHLCACDGMETVLIASIALGMRFGACAALQCCTFTSPYCILLAPVMIDYDDVRRHVRRVVWILHHVLHARPVSGATTGQ